MPSRSEYRASGGRALSPLSGLGASGGGTPLHRFAGLEALRPGLVAGITAVGPGDGAGSESDFGLTGGGTARDVARRYERLVRATGMQASVVARQVHGTHIVEANSSLAGGVLVVGEADGLVTSVVGLLLAVTAADCVPVFVVDVGGRFVALLHAGWRGAAAGILERAIARFVSRFEADPRDLAVYLGPAICGACYEVGPEVLTALGKEARGPGGIDLRMELAERAMEAGVSPARVTRSEWCTRCGPVRFHSHRTRGSEAGRMAAFLGVLPLAGARPDSGQVTTSAEQLQ